MTDGPSDLLLKLAAAAASLACVSAQAAPAPAPDLPRPTGGHSDSERVSPETQAKVEADACSRDAGRVRVQARLAMSADDFDEVIAKSPRRGLTAQTLKARYQAVFRDEILQSGLRSAARAHTLPEIETGFDETLVKLMSDAERAFTARTGVTAVVVLEGVELVLDDPACGGPVFTA